MRVLFALVVLVVISISPVQAMTCSGKPVRINASGILSTMTYYARPGQEDAIYKGLIEESKLLQQHGVQAFQVYRGPGGSGPAAQWQLVSANFAAHDAWLNEVGKILPDPDPFDASVLRMEHRHYLTHDGWVISPVCK